MQHEDIDKDLLEVAKQSVSDTVELVVEVDETKDLFQALSQTLQQCNSLFLSILESWMH